MMNTNFVLMLATMLATPFHFKDCVVVTEGFFEGCKGVVQDEWSGTPTKYDVQLTCKNETVNARFEAKQLKKCDK